MVVLKVGVVLQDYSIILDWLTFSGNLLNFDDILMFLGLLDYKDYFEPCPGKNFYMSGLKFQNHIYIYKGQRDNINGFCVDLTGQGCRFVESFGKYPLDEILKSIYNLKGFQVSRVDIAMDVIDNKLHISRLVKATEKGHYRCRSKFRNIMDSVNDGLQAYSLYFGKKGSNIFINIYDKRAERGFSPADMDNWTRIEIRLRHENAMGFLNSYVNNGFDIGRIYFGILNNYLAFLKPNKTDSNKARWELAPYWKRLLGHTEKIKVFYQSGIEYDYSKFEKDFFTQCGSRLVTYFKTGHTDVDLLRELAHRDIKPNSKQQFLIDNYEEGIDWKLI